MQRWNPSVAGSLSILLATLACRAEIKTVVDHNEGDQATAAFKFKLVPPPSKSGLGSKARFTVVDGERDNNGGDLEKLSDGKLPTEEDQPGENFFFNAATAGGRIAVDLGAATEIGQVNTYSWHPNTRGPQVYALYASDGTLADFKADPKMGTDPATRGWKLIAKVDTRPKEGQGDPGGQYGVSISDSDGPLGNYRYLLFDISRTEESDPFGNTFYSEIDIVGKKSSEMLRDPVTQPAADAGKYDITIDTSETPDLTHWADTELRPAVEMWYPKIVEMLPSEGFEAPRNFSITFRKDKRGVADTSGTRINCAADWFRKNLAGEAKGAVVHELVHVVQQYWNVRRRRDANPNPGWLVEGLADYIRWYKYEPESHGAEGRYVARAHYNDTYRPTANFLNWLTGKYDKDLVTKLNADMRQGKYNADLWMKYTGKTADDLGQEWKKELTDRQEK